MKIRFAALALAAMLSAAAHAQDYPARPVRLVAPYAAGGNADIFGRTLGQKLGDALKQPFVGENRGIGADFVAKSAPDGYTLLATANGPIVVNPVLYAKIPYDPVKDFAPVAQCTVYQYVLVTLASSPIRSIADLVDAARAKPGAVSYGSTGVGGGNHLARGSDPAGDGHRELRHLAVAGHPRPRRHVQGDRRSPQRGDRQGDARRRRARAHRHAGRQRNRDRHAGGLRRADQKRFADVRQADQGRQDSRAMKILVLPGDGIGPEITAATLAVLDRASALFGLGLEWQREEIGLVSLKKEGTTLPARVLEAARSSSGVILGPLSTYQYPPRDEGGINASAEFRTKLDLYANIRPARSRLGVGLTGKPVDLVIYRENTEGFYADRNMYTGIGEFMPTEDMALAVRRVTAKCCERIARRGFEAALARRKKVTAVHKANVFRISDGLFLREVRKVATEFPQVQLEEVIVDAMAALLLRDPMRFAVIVAENMYGDILSDEASELSGGLGLGGSINAGDSHCVAQAQHGSAPDIAGKDRANPTSLILSAAMLLEWMAARRGNDAFAAAARNIDAAVDATLKNPATRTADLGGKAGTREFAEAVTAKLG